MNIKNTLTAFSSIITGTNSNNDFTEIAYFNNIRKELLFELSKASSNIKIAVTWFTEETLFDELCNLLEKGIKIELIIADDEINNRTNGLDFQKFIDIGGELYYYHNLPMNHKYCIIDDNILFNGSYNWTYYSEYQSIENVIKSKGRQKLIKSFSANFNKLKKSLEPTKVAVKKNTLNIDANNRFSMKNYLAMDLLYQGKEIESLVPLESAMELLPNNSLLKTTYKKFVQKGITKKTITNLGIEAIMEDEQKRFSILIPTGSPIPCSNREIYTTSYDGQREAYISTFKGRAKYVTDNLQIGEMLMTGLPNKKAKKAKIEVVFDIDDEGVLSVTCINMKNESKMKTIYYIKDLIM